MTLASTPPYRLSLRIPNLSEQQYKDLKHSCAQPNDILSANDIEHPDFLDLLRPTVLQSSIIHALFQLGLASMHNITFVPTEVTAEFSTGERRLYQRLVDANNSLTSLRRSIFS